jgi:hypothetical protein
MHYNSVSSHIYLKFLSGMLLADPRAVKGLYQYIAIN